MKSRSQQQIVEAFGLRLKSEVFSHFEFAIFVTI